MYGMALCDTAYVSIDNPHHPPPQFLQHTRHNHLLTDNTPSVLMEIDIYNFSVYQQIVGMISASVGCQAGGSYEAGGEAGC